MQGPARDAPAISGQGRTQGVDRLNSKVLHMFTTHTKLRPDGT
jgi:hypothetical protein